MSNKGAWKLTPLMPEIVEQAKKALDAECARVNFHQKQAKSPAEQFDESHKKWLEGGREC